MGSVFSWTRSDVEEYKRLGNGSFGTVYHVNYWLYWREYAVKVVVMPNKTVRQQAMKEVEALRKVGTHRNVVEVYSSEITSDGALLIWMEFCQLGDLHRYMRNHNLTKRTIISVMKQLCDAVNYIHSKNVIHRDIKPANVLLQKPLTVKLADFGVGNFAESSSYFEQKYFSTQCGTPNYMAPEVRERRGYHKSADIYSMGVLLKVLIGKSTDVSQRGGKLYTLSEDMMKWQPNSRPTGSEVKRRLTCT